MPGEDRITDLMKVSANWRATLAFVHDVGCGGAWMGLYWFRYNLDLHQPQVTDIWHTLAWVLPLQAIIFLAFGLYRGLWRFASVPDLQRIVLAATLGAVAIPTVLVLLRLTAMVPRSVLVLYPLVLTVLMAGSRFAYRIWKEHRLYSPMAALGEPVLILGAGEAGARLTKELAHSRKWRIVGLLDDDPVKQGRLLRNIRVLGPIGELPMWTKRFGVRTVIFALPAAAHVVRRRVAELCAASGVEALTVPSYDDLISGRLAADDDPPHRARRPHRPRPRRARQRRPPGMARRPSGHGDWRRRARSAPNCADKSPAIARRASCCSICPNTASTRSTPRCRTNFRAWRSTPSSVTSSTRRWSNRCFATSARALSFTPRRTSTSR